MTAVTTTQRSVTRSLGNTVIEIADATTEMAITLRRGFKIANTALQATEANVYLTGVQDLVEKGLTEEGAIQLIESR